MILSEKEPQPRPSNPLSPQKTHSTSPNLPLRSRPLDFFYFLFFLIHIPPTLLLDLQAVYPAWLIPMDSKFRSIVTFYVSMTNDPVIGGIAGLFGEKVQKSMGWLRCFMWLELLFQLPTFIYGAYNLYHNTNLRTLYPLLILYGASTAATTLPCIALVLTTPSPDSTSTPPNTHITLNNLDPTLTMGQKWLLLGSYIPFLVVPLFMALDMAQRTSQLINKGLTSLRRDGKWE